METIQDLERRLGLVYREVTLSTGSVIGICDATPEQEEAIGQWWDAYDAAQEQQ